MKQSKIFILVLFSYKLFGQGTEKLENLKDYKYAIGVVGNHQAIGLQAEVKLNDNFGVRLAGTRVFGYPRIKEFGIAGIGLFTYYLPINSKGLEPVIGFGTVYSLYHWNLEFDKGNVKDLNIGGGIGTNIRFSNEFRGGINVFATNSYETDYNYVSKTMEIKGRELLILPTLTIDFLF